MCFAGGESAWYVISSIICFICDQQLYRTCNFFLGHAEGPHLQQHAPNMAILPSGWLVGHHESQPRLPMTSNVIIGWFAERYKSQPRLPITSDTFIG